MDVSSDHTNIADVVTTKIIALISDQLVPTDEGYTHNLPHLFAEHWCNDVQISGFKTTLDTWEQRLRGLGHTVMSTDRLLLVPAGQVIEFHLAPWQLSWDAAVSVKGLAWRCQLSVPVSRCSI